MEYVRKGLGNLRAAESANSCAPFATHTGPRASLALRVEEDRLFGGGWERHHPGNISDSSAVQMGKREQLHENFVQ